MNIDTPTVHYSEDDSFNKNDAERIFEETAKRFSVDPLQTYAEQATVERTKNLMKTFKQTSKISCAPLFRNLTLSKAVKVLLAKIAPYLKRHPDYRHEICMEELRKIIKNNGFKFEKNLMSLSEPQEWDILPSPGGVKWGTNPLFVCCSIDHRRGSFYYQVNPNFVNEIINPTSYKIIDLTAMMEFKSSYAFKLYELAHQYLDPKRNNGSTPFMTDEIVRKLLCIPNSRYTSTSKLVKNALINPLYEARALTGFNLACFSNDKNPRARGYCIGIETVDSVKANDFKIVYANRLRRQRWNNLESLDKKVYLAEYIFRHRMTPDERKQLRKLEAKRNVDEMGEEAAQLLGMNRYQAENTPDEAISGSFLYGPLNICENYILDIESDKKWAPSHDLWEIITERD